MARVTGELFSVSAPRYPTPTVDDDRQVFDGSAGVVFTILKDNFITLDFFKMKCPRRDILKIGAVAAFGATTGLFHPVKVSAREDISKFFILPEPDMTNRRALLETPEKIVEGGRIHVGLFKKPFRKMNLLESNSLGGDATTWLGLPKILEWVGVGMAHPSWYFGFILVDAHSSSLASFYCFNRKTGKVLSYDSFVSASRVRVADSMWDDASYLHRRDFTMDVRHRLVEGRHEVGIDIKGSAKKPDIRADLIWHEDLDKIQPLVRMSPLTGPNFVFNHKAQMPVQGLINIGDQKVVFDPDRDLANMDEVRYCDAFGKKMNYTWFNFGGFDPEGRVVGLNAFHSKQRQDTTWSENCIWAGTTLSLIGPVDFKMDPRDTTKPWRAVDLKGRVDVTFLPEGGKTINLGLLGKYFQKCGRFRGTLVDDAGTTHKVNDFHGCAEYVDFF